MNAETENYQAFELYSVGLEKYKKYIRSNNQEILTDALKNFGESLKLDAQFFMPRYYSAVVNDLLGKYREASEELKKLDKVAPYEFQDLVRYSLALSLYHHYKTDKLDESIAYFSSIDSKNPYVNLLAKAGKLQSMAVGMLLNYRSSEFFINAKVDKKKIMSEGRMVHTKLFFSRLLYFRYRRGDTKNHRKDIQWITYNAMGLANMYLSDTVRFEKKNGSVPTKFLKEFGFAQNYFKKADKINPNHWAILSNIGSLYLRRTVLEFIYKTESWKKWFDKTIGAFEIVLEVRPNYDFAYYELGKLKRMTENYDEAIKSFEKALESQENWGQNVEPERIEKQINRCKGKEKDANFF